MKPCWIEVVKPVKPLRKCIIATRGCIMLLRIYITGRVSPLQHVNSLPGLGQATEEANTQFQAPLLSLSVNS